MRLHSWWRIYAGRGSAVLLPALRPALWPALWPAVWPSLLLGLFLGGCAQKAPYEPSSSLPPPDPTQKVVLVIIDGLRYSEGLGDPALAHVPRMGALADEGARVEPFLNDGITVTARAVPAIWTGSWVEPIELDDPECGSTNQFAAAPTVFEYYRKQLAKPAQACIYLTGNVGCPWRGSLDPQYGSGYWPVYDTRGSSDGERWEVAQSILALQQPDFFLLYLPDVDHAGHNGDWDAYLAAIDGADQIVGDLWATLQASPHYAGVTTLLVTNDHGRHDNRPSDPHGGFSGHGDGCNGCRTIELLAVGPQVKHGYVSTRTRSIPDIVPTIAVLLGFSADQATGSPMDELLDLGR